MTNEPDLGPGQGGGNSQILEDRIMKRGVMFCLTLLMYGQIGLIARQVVTFERVFNMSATIGDVSANGSIMVGGSVTNTSYRWEDGSVQEIYGEFDYISDDGNVMAGVIRNYVAGRAYGHLLENDQLVPLSVTAFYTQCLSGDGKVVGGYDYDTGGGLIWKSGEVQKFDVVPAALSFDGSVWVGRSSSNAYRVEDGTPIALPRLPSYDSAEANAISSDGSRVFGH